MLPVQRVTSNRNGRARQPVRSVAVRPEQSLPNLAARLRRMLVSARLPRCAARLQARVRGQCRVRPDAGLCEPEVCRPLPWHMRLGRTVSGHQSQSHLRLSARLSRRSVPELLSSARSRRAENTIGRKPMSAIAVWTELTVSSGAETTRVLVQSQLHRQSSLLPARVCHEPGVSLRPGLHPGEVQRSLLPELWSERQVRCCQSYSVLQLSARLPRGCVHWMLEDTASCNSGTKGPVRAVSVRRERAVHEQRRNGALHVHSAVRWQPVRGRMSPGVCHKRRLCLTASLPD